MKNYEFIIMWYDSGLECIVPVDRKRIDNEYYQKVIDRLSGLNQYGDQNTYEQSLGQTLKMLTLRASANFQRHYEIYHLTTQGITEKQLKNLFDSDPQMIVNIIREKGQHLYGSGAGFQQQILK